MGSYICQIDVMGRISPTTCWLQVTHGRRIRRMYRACQTHYYRGRAAARCVGGNVGRRVESPTSRTAGAVIHVAAEAECEDKASCVDRCG